MDDPQVHDVAVIGAGPAGCAAALRVLQRRPDASVVLLDAARFPRDKTCGDGVAPHARDVFERLGVSGLADGYPPVPLLALQSPSGRQVVRRMTRPVRVIPRRVLDARLVQAAQAAGAELRHHRVRQADDRGDRVVLDGEVAARVVIAADGANSVMRRQVQRRPPEARGWAVALRGYAVPRQPQPDRLLIAVAREDCPSYAWSFPLADGRANVGFGVFTRAVDGGRAELLDRLHGELPGLRLDVDTVRAHHLPLTTGRPPLVDGRVLLAGDAAGLVNPLTGEGIYYAAVSGVLAADAAALGSAAGAAYRTSLARLLRRHHRHTAALSTLARSPRFVEAAVAAAAARQRTFDDVVELGLGCGTADVSTVLSLGGSWLGGLVPDLADLLGLRAAQARRSQAVASAGSSRAPSGSGTLEASSSPSDGSGTADEPVLASTSTSPLRNASTSSP